MPAWCHPEVSKSALRLPQQPANRRGKLVRTCLGTLILDTERHGLIGAGAQRNAIRHLMRTCLGIARLANVPQWRPAAKLIFASTDVQEARRHRDEFVKRFPKAAPKALACLEDGFEDAMRSWRCVRNIAGGCERRT
jgi:hypothetical protein